MAASLSAIFNQLPKVLMANDMPVSKLIRKYPEDALGIIYRNVPTVFGPQARTVTYRVLDGMIPNDATQSVDVYFLVFDDYNLDDEEMSFTKKIRIKDTYKKATLRRIGPDEEIREDLLLDDWNCWSDIIETKRRKGKLIELIDEVGTYILDLGDRPDEEFFFFHPHEPLVVTFVTSSSF
jgi:hypothetical protein